MLNIIIIVATAMGLVAFGGLGYTYGLHIAYDVGGLMCISSLHQVLVLVYVH